MIFYLYIFFAENKPIMYEKSFLQDIAIQNFSKYDVKPRTTSPIIVSFGNIRNNISGMCCLRMTITGIYFNETMTSMGNLP